MSDHRAAGVINAPNTRLRRLRVHPTGYPLFSVVTTVFPRRFQVAIPAQGTIIA